MLVGVPKEIKDHEYRVGLIPSTVRELTAKGHQVLVEANAGIGAGLPDADYLAAGAEIVPDPAPIFARAELIVKVKEPLPLERKRLRPGQILFTYLHLAPDREQTEDLIAAAGFLKSRPECSGRIGAVGFCFGGGIVNMLAVRVPDLAAGVPFYGSQPSAEDAAKIKAPLLIHYAEHDDRINLGWKPFERALRANSVKYEMHMYPGTQHGFHNNSTPRYHEAWPDWLGSGQSRSSRGASPEAWGLDLVDRRKD